MKPKPVEKPAWWFKIQDQPGLRVLKEQLKGLEPLPTSRKTILDLGCAEGLIGKHFIDVFGADLVHGLEIVPERVEMARKLCSGYDNAVFSVANLDDLAATDRLLLPKYDVVLMLAIAHKLLDPNKAIRWAANKAKEHFVIRMPGRDRTFVDKRSNNVKVSPLKLLAPDFKLVSESLGGRDEMTLIFQRKCPAPGS